MARFQRTIPRIWLMSDERLGDALLRAACKLPQGSGIIFRHDSLSEGQRRRLFGKLHRIARRRGHRLLLAGGLRQALRWGADGLHDRSRRQRVPATMLLTMPAHNMTEIARANMRRPDALLLSPLYPTHSHPSTKALGISRFALLARRSHAPVIALGGMTRARAAMLDRRHTHGWAAISAFSD